MKITRKIEYKNGRNICFFQDDEGKMGVVVEDEDHSKVMTDPKTGRITRFKDVLVVCNHTAEELDNLSDQQVIDKVRTEMQ